MINGAFCISQDYIENFPGLQSYPIQGPCRFPKGAIGDKGRPTRLFYLFFLQPISRGWPIITPHSFPCPPQIERCSSFRWWVSPNTALNSFIVKARRLSSSDKPAYNDSNLLCRVGGLGVASLSA